MDGKGFEAEGVWKLYGPTVALRDVTVEFGRGLNVIVGPNGSGKTTLLKILLGLSRPSRGRVLSLGVVPWMNPRLLSRVGAGFEGMGIPWWLTGLDVLRLYAASRRIDWDTVREYASMLGVDEYWGRTVRSYSMGMRKRLILVMAFSGAEEALVLDEPYTLLDRRAVKLVDSLIARQANDKPVLVASHVATPALEGADKVVVLVGGRVAALASKAGALEVLRDYVCDVGDLSEALSSISALGGKVEYFEYRGGRLLVSLSPGGSIREIRGVTNCRPTFSRLLSYEDVLEDLGGER